jgi:hypothetical protein
MSRHCCPKGRANKLSQRCLYGCALPNQFNGDTDMTQQCLDHNSPRERSYRSRRNAVVGSPLPPVTGGQFMRAEMPLLRHPTGEANAQTQQCRNKSASPNDFNRSHHDIAEMLQVKRSKGRVSHCSQKCPMSNTLPNQFTGGHSRRAEMPRTNRPHRIWAIIQPRKRHRFVAQ